MNIDFCPHEADHHLGVNATHPIEPCHAGWEALLLVAGIELVARRALPNPSGKAHSCTSHCGF